MKRVEENILRRVDDNTPPNCIVRQLPLRVGFVSPSKTFILAWHEWIRLTVPTQNFRLNRSEASTYNVELALDHSRSYVHALGSGVIDGKEYDFVKLASNKLEELNKIRLEVEACEVGEAESKELRNYIEATQSLLEEIRTSIP